MDHRQYAMCGTIGASKTRYMVKTYDVAQQAKTCETVDIAGAWDKAFTAKDVAHWERQLKHGPRDLCKAWPQWTSEGDVDHGPTEWHRTCLGDPLTMMGPSDDWSATTFQKSSWRIACSLRWTICKVQGWCVWDELHGQDVRCGSTGQHTRDDQHGPHKRCGANGSDLASRT